MDTEHPGSGGSVVVVLVQGALDGLGVEQVMGGLDAGGCGLGYAMGGQFIGQVFQADKPSPAHDEGAFDGVFQFAYVAGPGMHHEQRQGFGGDSLD